MQEILLIARSVVLNTKLLRLYARIDKGRGTTAKAQHKSSVA